MGRIVEAHREKTELLEAKNEGNNEVEYLVDVLLRVQQHGDLDFHYSDEIINAVLVSLMLILYQFVCLKLEEKPSIFDMMQGFHSMITFVRTVNNSKSQIMINAM